MLYIDFDYFKGPLDLLLELCQKNKIEINTINIEQIIDVYLQYIKQPQNNFSLVSQYLVIAAHFVELKTRLMLKLELLEEQTLEIEDFINSLLEYKKYQKYSLKLQNLLQQEMKFIAKEHTKIANNIENYSTNYQKNQLILIKTYEKILQNFKVEQKKEHIKKVNLSEISLKDVKEKIASKVKKYRNLNFSSLKFTTRIELIVTFLALLELTNTQEIKLIEEKEDIKIYAI